MNETRDLLIEIGAEELPPKMLHQLAIDFAQNIEQNLKKVKLDFGAIKHFASPRRLAVLVKDVSMRQADYSVEKEGPNVKISFDEQGKPTKAAEGFARSCGVTVNDLQTKQTNKGECIVCNYTVEGKTTQALLPDIIQHAVSTIHIPKPMRWGSTTTQFVRPVHWVLVLFGEEVIEFKLLNVQSSKQTFGHRFHHPQTITLSNANDYEKVLSEKGYVIADFQQRQSMIRNKVKQLAASKNAIPVIDDTLLIEVTGLVEWPVAMMADFNPEFLSTPKEALISAIQDHQKAFPLEDKNGTLLPHFILISNIESKQPKQVKKGNERVMNARLADAAFFYQTDSRQSLESRLDMLKHVIFQNELGSLYDKSQRISKLSGYIAKAMAETTPINQVDCQRAGLLCKTDLVTDMVGEFPELQGIMGYYYANNDAEEALVAQAIRDHYLPRFASDQLPEDPVSQSVAIADRIDTLVGIFGINKIPTGDKDPFGLRRAALGVMRILIENELNLNLLNILQFAVDNYSQTLTNQNVVEQLLDFMFDRLRAWYQEQGIRIDTLASVLNSGKVYNKPFDVHQRILAVDQFRKLPEAAALAAANKRASNILTKTKNSIKSGQNNVFQTIQPDIFENQAEKNLYDKINSLQSRQNTKNQNYTQVLTSLANLREPIDRFFDDVMVMVDDEKIRNNRLALLSAVRELFLSVADISKLQEGE